MSIPQFLKTIAAIFLLSITHHFCYANDVEKNQWIPLFNGKDLQGWVPKIAKHPLGENYNNTFRVEDGIIKACYKDYEDFDMQFGHLYTTQTHENYMVRLEYRFDGAVMHDAPSWTAFNSGIMLHCQSPLSLGIDQSFPVSLEGQFLAKGTSAGTQTSNVCTPGTDIVFEGEFTKQHILDSSSVLFPPETWVTFEAEVHSDTLIIYRINGKEVLRYSHPTLDPEDNDAKRLLENGANQRVTHGHIALQAEGHPVWFRNIRIKPLDSKDQK